MTETRVLHVVGRMDRGGAETWLMQVLRRSQPTRVRHDFVVHQEQAGAFDDEVRALGSSITPITSHRNPPRYAAELARYLRCNGPYDIVHSHVHRFSGVVLMAASAAGVRVRIAHSHTTAPNGGRFMSPSWCYARAAEVLIARYATLGLAASKDAGRALFSGRAGRCPWQVLHCGIDLAPFRPSHARDVVRSELGIPADSFVLGHIGNFTPAKNHQLLLRTFAAVAQRRGDAVLLMVGEGPLKSTIKAEVAKRGLKPMVVFAGSRTDIPRLLAGAIDVFVFPSTWEGLGLAAVEAQAAGVPVLLSDRIPAEADVVKGLIRRVSVDADPEEWARAVLEFEHVRLSAEGFERVWASDFNIARSVEALGRLYVSQQGPHGSGTGAGCLVGRSSFSNQSPSRQAEPLGLL